MCSTSVNSSIAANGIANQSAAASLNPTAHFQRSVIVDGIAYLSTFARSFYQAGHINDQRGSGWMDGAAPWNRSYRCAEGGYITLCPVEARFYAVLLETLQLTEHPLFADLDQWDQTRWPRQIEHLQSLFGGKPRQHWCDLLEGTDACFAPVLNYGEVQDHPHNRARASYVEVDGEWHPRPAPRFSLTVPEPAWEED